MILSVARKEIAIQLRDGRISTISLVLMLSCLAALVAGWINFQDYRQQSQTFAEEIRKQWTHQGKRHPHRAAHYGIYVSKPVMSLTILDPGLAPATGQAIWLNAHDRTTYSNPPSHDNIVSSVTMNIASPSALLMLLGGLFALIVGAFGIVKEREQGVLRQVIIQGASLQSWLIGKYIGLFAVVIIPFLPLMVLGSLLAYISSSDLALVDLLLRLIGFVATGTLFLLSMLGVGLCISAFARQTRTALMVVFSFWIVAFIIAPRASSSLIERIIPTTTWEEFQAASGKVFNEGYDDRPGYSKQLAELEKNTAQEYGVDTLDDLPVGFSGIRMIHMGEWSAEVSDREYAQVQDDWEQQNRIRTTLAAFFPYLAARSLSQGFAGADWPHYRDFAEKSEAHRRSVIYDLDQVITRETLGTKWEMDADHSVWSRTKNFNYHHPDFNYVLKHQWPTILILVFWFIGGLLILRMRATRLKP